MDLGQIAIAQSDAQNRLTFNAANFDETVLRSEARRKYLRDTIARVRLAFVSCRLGFGATLRRTFARWHEV